MTHEVVPSMSHNNKFRQKENGSVREWRIEKKTSRHIARYSIYDRNNAQWQTR